MCAATATAASAELAAPPPECPVELNSTGMMFAIPAPTRPNPTIPAIGPADHQCRTEPRRRQPARDTKSPNGSQTSHDAIPGQSSGGHREREGREACGRDGDRDVGGIPDAEPHGNSGERRARRAAKTEERETTT